MHGGHGRASNPFAGMKKPKAAAAATADGPMDTFCMHWMGIPASHALRLVTLGLAAGAFLETFMIKVWVGQTNCACERSPSKDDSAY
jgi:hypothetical protein